MATVKSSNIEYVYKDTDTSSENRILRIYENSQRPENLRWQEPPHLVELGALYSGTYTGERQIVRDHVQQYIVYIMVGSKTAEGLTKHHIWKFNERTLTIEDITPSGQISRYCVMFPNLGSTIGGFILVWFGAKNKADDNPCYDDSITRLNINTEFVALKDSVYTYNRASNSYAHLALSDHPNRNCTVITAFPVFSGKSVNHNSVAYRTASIKDLVIWTAVPVPNTTKMMNVFNIFDSNILKINSDVGTRSYAFDGVWESTQSRPVKTFNAQLGLVDKLTHYDDLPVYMWYDTVNDYYCVYTVRYGNRGAFDSIQWARFHVDSTHDHGGSGIPTFVNDKKGSVITSKAPAIEITPVINKDKTFYWNRAYLSTDYENALVTATYKNGRDTSYVVANGYRDYSDWMLGADYNDLTWYSVTNNSLTGNDGTNWDTIVFSFSEESTVGMLEAGKLKLRWWTA